MDEEDELTRAAGIFCDISGTLISYDDKSPDVRTDEDVVAFLDGAPIRVVEPR